MNSIRQGINQNANYTRRKTLGFYDPKVAIKKHTLKKFLKGTKADGEKTKELLN